MSPLSLMEPRGFGYDPIFYIPTLGRHMAELDMDEKERHKPSRYGYEESAGVI